MGGTRIFSLGIPPSTSTAKPRVKYDLGLNINKTSQELVFVCDFDPVPDVNNLFYYRIFWYMNDHNSPSYVSKAVSFHQLYSTHLRHSSGLGTTTLGNMVIA